jgi:hypothetical protein
MLAKAQSGHDQAGWDGTGHRPLDHRPSCGHIWAENNQDGGGATFHVTLPAAGENAAQ